MLPKKPHDPDLKCGGPQMCPDCKEAAEAEHASKWRERWQAAMDAAKEGEHAWFQYKNDQFNCCAKCGNIQRKDGKNSPCKGIVKIGLR